MKLAEMNERNLSLRSRVINGVQKHYGVLGGEFASVGSMGAYMWFTYLLVTVAK